MPVRVGGEKDLIHLHEEFSAIGFEVEPHPNLRCHELMEVLEHGM